MESKKYITAQDFNDLSYKIRGCIYNVASKLGPGLLESIYERALMIELADANLEAKNQVPIDVIYNNKSLGLDFRLDIIVEDAIILELKSVESIKPIHSKQLLTYLKLANKRLGLLVNFDVANISQGIIRVVNDFPTR